MSFPLLAVGTAAQDRERVLAVNVPQLRVGDAVGTLSVVIGVVAETVL
jgi:hypothetical protein